MKGETMFNSTDGKRTFRVSAFLLPMTVLGGALAASFIIVSDLTGSTTDYRTFDSAAFQDIEFVVRADQPEAVALRASLQESCAATGCDADTLHPMILASVNRMTAAELEDALDAQTRIQAESQALRSRSLPGTDTARLAELEILAAERITALYEVELAAR